MSNIEKLSSSSSLKDLVDRQELLTNNIEEQKNTLKEILISKNVEVADSENKLSILIQKVNEMENPDANKLWLYKDGNEYKNITNGFIEMRWDDSSGTLTKQSNKLNVVSKAQCVGFITSNKIVNDGYKNACVEYKVNSKTGSPSIRLDVYNKNNPKSTADRISMVSTSDTTLTKQILDISNISEFYIACSCYAGTLSSSDSANIDFMRIWLEK